MTPATAASGRNRCPSGARSAITDAYYTLFSRNSATATNDERAAVLAGPLTIAVKGFVQDQVEKVVASDAFKTFWVEANRFGQVRNGQVVWAGGNVTARAASVLGPLVAAKVTAPANVAGDAHRQTARSTASAAT